MKHLRLYILFSGAIALLFMGFFVVRPTLPADAASRIIYVDVRLTSAQRDSWAINSAVSYVDQYTGSTMRFRSCVSGYKCIIILRKTVNSSWAAVTTGASATYSTGTRAYISLNPQREYYSWSAQRSIVIHELGHAHGITWHSDTCTNVMYSRVFCASGSLPPLRFSDPQRTRLQSN